MPGIRIKYVGPLETKVFHDYTFQRCHTDDASGPNGIAGEMAIEVPDLVANAALKHREVFLQWNQLVPEKVKALRLSRTDALRREGEEGVENWLKYVAVAEMMPTDNPRKAEIRANEIAGAKAQVDVARAKITQAAIERVGVLRDMYGENVPPELQWTDAGAAASAALVDKYKEALENKDTENQALRAELEALKAQMERDGRLTPDEEVAPPAVAEVSIEARVTEAATEEVDIFGDATHGLEVFGLGVRALSSLTGAGFTTAEQVAGTTAADLLALPNLGEASVALVREGLAKLGLALAGE